MRLTERQEQLLHGTGRTGTARGRSISADVAAATIARCLINWFALDWLSDGHAERIRHGAVIGTG